jgi:hypothetical protein
MIIKCLSLLFFLAIIILVYIFVATFFKNYIDEAEHLISIKVSEFSGKVIKIDVFESVFKRGPFKWSRGIVYRFTYSIRGQMRRFASYYF